MKSRADKNLARIRKEPWVCQDPCSFVTNNFSTTNLPDTTRRNQVPEGRPKIARRFNAGRPISIPSKSRTGRLNTSRNRYTQVRSLTAQMLTLASDVPDLTVFNANYRQFGALSQHSYTRGFFRINTNEHKSTH